MRAQVIYNQELENQKQQIINVSLLAGNKIGPQGLKGDSAYKIAVQNGFEGTEEEWLASLVGEKGDTGRTPEITADKLGTTTTIYADGVAIGTVEDGMGVPVGGATGQILTKKSVVDGDTEWQDVNAVIDVTINGASLVNEETKIANIPIAGADRFGVIKVADSGEMKGMDGLTTRNQRLSIFPATIADVKNMSSTSLAAGSRPIVPVRLNAATFYGLARAAGDSTQLQSDNAIGNYTEEAKTAIRSMLDVPSTGDIPDVPVEDVTVNGNSIVNNGVANIPQATRFVSGVIKMGGTTSGITLVNGGLYTVPANSMQIKDGYMTNVIISPAVQHESMFYGLAKAAGDSTQSSSSNAVGTYTDSAKSAIQSMLGIDTAISDAIGDITGFDFEVVNTLPVSGEKGIIYLVSHSHGNNDAYDEYIWINDGYEKIGSTDIDLSGYATTTYVNTELANKQDVINYGTPTSADVGKALMPKVISNGEVTEWEFGESGSIDDVQVNGVSVVQNGVASIPAASESTYGAVKYMSAFGITTLYQGIPMINCARAEHIKDGTNGNLPIVPNHQHEAVFYGLAKAAGHDEKDSLLSLGTYTDEAKSAIQTMFGLNNKIEAPATAGTSGQVLTSDGNGGQTWEDPSGAVTDVTMNGVSVLDTSTGIANIPIGKNNTFGVVKGNFLYGTSTNNNGEIYLYRADDQVIKQGTNMFQPIVPNNQHKSIFYGLAKVAGHDEKDSTNAVGTYTDEAKSAIQSMLGVPASDIIAPQFDSTLNYSAGDYVINEGKLYKFTTSHSTGALDGSDTEEVTIGEEFINSTIAITNAQIDALFA